MYLHVFCIFIYGFSTMERLTDDVSSDYGKSKLRDHKEYYDDRSHEELVEYILQLRKQVGEYAIDAEYATGQLKLVGHDSVATINKLTGELRCRDLQLEFMGEQADGIAPYAVSHALYVFFVRHSYSLF